MKQNLKIEHQEELSKDQEITGNIIGHNLYSFRHYVPLLSKTPGHGEALVRYFKWDQPYTNFVWHLNKQAYFLTQLPVEFVEKMNFLVKSGSSWIRTGQVIVTERFIFFTMSPKYGNGNYQQYPRGFILHDPDKAKLIQVLTKIS